MSIKKVQILNLEEITKEEFAPYGQIWGREEEAPIEVLNNMKYYSNNVDLGPEIEQIDAGLLVCNSRGKKIEYFERHPETSESFCILEGECIFVMAPGDNTQKKPDASLIQNFLYGCNKSSIVKKSIMTFDELVKVIRVLSIIHPILFSAWLEDRMSELSEILTARNCGLLQFMDRGIYAQASCSRRRRGQGV